MTASYPICTVVRQSARGAVRRQPRRRELIQFGNGAAGAAAQRGLALSPAC